MNRCSSNSHPFKQRKSLGTRTRDVAEIREKYLNKIPMVVERYHKEKVLLRLERTEFLVSQDPFMFTLRSRLCLSSTQTFYLLANNKSLPSPSLTMMEIYQDNKNDDGFLYISYTSQETFGNV